MPAFPLSGNPEWEPSEPLKGLVGCAYLSFTCCMEEVQSENRIYIVEHRRLVRKCSAFK